MKAMVFGSKAEVKDETPLTNPYATEEIESGEFLSHFQYQITDGERPEVILMKVKNKKDFYGSPRIIPNQVIINNVSYPVKIAYWCLMYEFKYEVINGKVHCLNPVNIRLDHLRDRESTDEFEGIPEGEDASKYKMLVGKDGIKSVTVVYINDLLYKFINGICYIGGKDERAFLKAFKYKVFFTDDTGEAYLYEKLDKTNRERVVFPTRLIHTKRNGDKVICSLKVVKALSRFLESNNNNVSADYQYMVGRHIGVEAEDEFLRETYENMITREDSML